MAQKNSTPTARTQDDELIDNITEWLPNLFNLGSGPALSEEFVQKHAQTKVSTEALETTDYGDHIHRLASWFEQVQSTLQSDVLYEDDTTLVFGDIADTLTAETMHSPDFDPTDDWDQPHASFRLRDARATVPDTAPLFEITADYYITGETYVSLQVTTGYKAKSATAGGDRLTREFVIDGPITEATADAATRTLNDRKPFVISRVHELVTEEDAKLSHARAIALDECGLSNSEIAAHLELSEGAVRSYKSKFNAQTTTAERRLVAQAGVPKRILAVHEFTRSSAHRETGYLCETIRTDVDARYAFTRVIEASAETPSLDVSTETYATVDDVTDALRTRADDSEGGLNPADVSALLADFPDRK